MNGKPPSKTAGGPHGESLAQAVLVTAILYLLVGCTVTWGSPARTDQLETLKPGVSSKADVVRALGAPRGEGVARNTDKRLRQALEGDDTREVWFYEHSMGNLSQTNMKILFVFFHKEKYDGYIWFSSSRFLKATR